MEAEVGTNGYYEAELTQAQWRILQSILPKNYSLKFQSKSTKRDITPIPIKKQVSSDGLSAKRQPSTEPNIENAPKRVLRDKRNSRNHLETKYSDYDAIGATNSKSKNLNEGAKKCLGVIQKLKKHPYAEPFLYPVDGTIIVDYYQKIRDPMDLSTVEKNLKAGSYSSTLEFASDIRKIWNNAFIYNNENSPIFQMTKEMSAHFEKIFKEVENVPLTGNLHHLQRQVERLSKELKELHSQKGTVKAPSIVSKSNKSSASHLDRPMSMQEKRQLGQNIRNLPPEYLRGVCQIVSEGLPDSGNNKEVLEFDIDTLPVRKVRELEKYVKSKLNLVNKSQSKKKGGKKENSIITKGSNGTPNKMQDYDNGGFAMDQAADIYQKQQYLQQQQQMLAQQQGKNGGRARDEDVDSNLSESSFITDSDESNSDDDHKKKHKQKKI